MKRILKAWDSMKVKLAPALPASFLLLLMSRAAAVESSALATGAKKLIADLSNWLLVLAPIAGGVLIIYCCIWRAAADETDTKKWNNRITVIIVSTIGAVVASATLNLVLGYFR